MVHDPSPMSKSAPRPFSSSSASRPRWQLRRAWRSVRHLLEDPDDTRAVFEIIDALPGRSGDRAFRRFAATETGQRVLSDRRSLLDTLSDRESLLALSAGTLGRAYAEFMETEEISADGLVEASGEDRFENPDAVLFSDRLRDMHDLHHVVTGYGRDLRGESALLAYTYVQIRTPGIGLIVLMAYLESDSETRRLIREGVRRGLRSEWLPAVDWEYWLGQPLELVREAFRLVDLPDYEPDFSAAAPAASRAG